MKILALTASLPDPAAGGEGFHAYQLLAALAADHDVSVLALGHHPKDGLRLAAAARVCRHVELGVVRKWPRPLQAARMAVRLARGWPSDTVFYVGRDFAASLERLLSRDRYDAVHFERYVLAPYLDVVRRAGVPRAVLRLHNVNSQLARRMAAVEPHWAFRAKHRADARACAGWERGRLRGFDQLLAVSDLDAAALRTLCAPTPVGTLPLGFDVAGTPLLPPPADGPHVLLLGPLHYLPNADAARFVLDEVLGPLRRAVPAASLSIVGARPPADLAARAQVEHFELPGRVPDVVPWYRRAAVLAVPLRAGSGVRHKILEALALGRPVVSTTVGAEGLGLVDGEHLLIADSPDAFAAALARVLTDPALAARLVAAGRAFVEAHHSLAALRAAACRVYAS